MKFTYAALTAAALFAGTSVQAASHVVFEDDFESPNVLLPYNLSNTSQTASSDWVRADQGFGASRNGIVDEAENSGNNFTDPVGEQAYAFRYTNSGVTTADGVIGTLIANTKYTVSFDVVLDGHDSGDDYSAALVTFNGANRNDVRNNEGETATLASTSGSYGGTTYKKITFGYTADGTEGTLGQDVALRFYGKTGASIIDNVKVSTTIIPSPSALGGGLAMLGLIAARRRRSA